MYGSNKTNYFYHTSRQTPGSVLRARRYFFFLNTPFIFPKAFLAVCPTEPADSFALPGVKLSLLGSRLLLPKAYWGIQPHF